MCNIHVKGIPEKKEKGTEDILETIMTENFPQIIVRHQASYPGSLRKRINAKKKTRHIIFRPQKIKDKEKILKEDKGKKTPYLTLYL